MELYDYVIIGSGPSGSVLAWELTRAGARCLMLEAGQEYAPGDFPRHELYANTRLMWNGGMDASADASLLFLRGKVLGGGSIINQCLLDRFDDIAFDDWRARTGLDWLSTRAMAPHYDVVESQLSLQRIETADWNRNARIYVDGFEKLGLKWAPLRRGQSCCGGRGGDEPHQDCMRCLGGCPRESKQSMPVTFLRQARRQGLRVETGFEVTGLVYGASHVTVWGRQQGRVRQVMGRRCILAAGALGTTKLLLQSGLGDRLPALGQGFYCHPQFMTLARFQEPVDAHKGPFQAVKSDDPRFRAQGFKLENVFAGPIALALLKPGYGVDHHRFMRAYRHQACIEVAVRDVTPGRIGLDRSGRLRVDKKLGDADWQRARAGLRVVEDVLRSQGGQELMTSPITIGLHLMGGCSLGRRVSDSVVDEGFRVHGYPNLLIADSSVFPSAPGINPSLTIMAMAQRAAGLILAEAGQRPAASPASGNQGPENNNPANKDKEQEVAV